MKNASCFLQGFFELLVVGNNGYLDLIHQLGELIMELGHQNFTQVFQSKALLESLLANANPGDGSLPHMKNPVGARDKLVNSALQNCFKIFLEFSPCHLNQYTQRHSSTLLDFVNIRTDELYFAILNLLHGGSSKEFKSLAVLCPELNLHLFFPHSFSLKTSPIGNRDINLGDFNFQTSHLNGLSHYSFSGNAGDHVLIGAYTCGQDLG
ncbi:hypothetical protein ES703_92618 [subsurface metagenome]